MTSTRQDRGVYFHVVEKEASPGPETCSVHSQAPPDRAGGSRYLIRRHRWEEARDLLEDLDRRFPNRTEVVSGLAIVYQQLGDTQQLQPVCARLSKLFPQDPDILLSLAGAYLNNGRVLLAQRTFQQVLNRWPTHRLAEKARRTVAE